MKYKQGKQRVATGDVFPYPLKCWYDDEYIYVKVLRIPEPKECKLSPYIMKGVKDGLYDINNYPTKKDKRTYHGYMGNYFDKLCVCIEIKESRNVDYSSSNGNRENVHKIKSGNFYHKNTVKDFPKAVKGATYTFPLSQYFNRMAHYVESQGYYPFYPPFTKIRATFRFLRYGDRKWNSSNHLMCLDRTGLYSNIAIIEK